MNEFSNIKNIYGWHECGSSILAFVDINNNITIIGHIYPMNVLDYEFFFIPIG